MIQAIAAVYLLILFAVWNSNDWVNLLIKLTSLVLGIALGFQALQEFGYIIQIP